MSGDRWHAHPPNIGKEREQVISVSHRTNRKRVLLKQAIHIVSHCPWSVTHFGTMIFVLNHGSFKYRLTQD